MKSAALTSVLFLVALPGVCDAQESWRVSAEPTVTIGKIDGGEGDVISNAIDGFVLSDGTIVIWDGLRGHFKLRYYEPDGDHIASVGRWGQGPFEFEGANGIHHLPGDSVLVTSRDMRYAVFGPRGERIRTGRLDPSPFYMSRPTMLDSRHLADLHPLGPPMPDPGRWESERQLVIFDLVTGEATPGPTIQAETSFVERASSGGVSVYPMPFSPFAFAASGRGVVWFARSDQASMTGYSHEAEERRSVDILLESRPVTRAAERRYRDFIATRFSGDTGRRWARWAESMEFPDRLPRFGDFRVDRRGNLWLQEYELPWAEGDQLWHVYRPEGGLLAEVSVPPSAQARCSRGRLDGCLGFMGILDIGDDYVLLNPLGEFDVQQVTRHEILKGH